MPITVLITGFGPFPGAPDNPTGPLVTRLARLRHPALAGARIVPHVFETRYATVDRELPRLLARHKPDVVLMFGLAAQAQGLRVETLARNALAELPDVSGALSPRPFIAAGKGDRAMPAPVRALRAAARRAGVPVTLSRDAGGYLCNYLCWHAATAVARPRGPRLAAFVHVPAVSAVFTPETFVRAGTGVLIAMIAAARR